VYNDIYTSFENSLIFQGKTHFRGKLNCFSKGIFRKKIGKKRMLFYYLKNLVNVRWNVTIN